MLKRGSRWRHEWRPFFGDTLEDIHRLLKPQLTIVHRNRVRPARLVTRPKRHTGVGTVFAQNVVHHIDESQTLAITLVAAHDALQDIHARFQGRHTLAHVLDDRMRTGDLDVLLAAASRAGRTHLLIRVAPGADDRRIPEPAGNLPGQPAGGRAPGHGTVGCEHGTMRRA